MNANQLQRGNQITLRLKVLTESKSRWTQFNKLSPNVNADLTGWSNWTSLDTEHINCDVLKQLTLAAINSEIDSLTKEFDAL